MNKLKLAVIFTIIALANACGNSANQTSNSMQNSDMTINHSQMDQGNMQNAPNAANAPFDLQFLDTMTSHHEGAVEMAKMVDGRTENADVKKFAAQIIADQSKEINQMKDWRAKWFPEDKPAINMQMSGMADSMKMDMTKLGATKGKDFDFAFVEMMIPHHEGAVTMAKDALEKSQHQEVKTLAENIIKTQTAEIKMMQDWKTKWAK